MSWRVVCTLWLVSAVVMVAAGPKLAVGVSGVEAVPSPGPRTGELRSPRDLQPRPNRTLRRIQPLRLESKKKYLIIASVGDNSMHRMSWLDRADERAFDLVVIYYGRGRDFHCEECSGVFSMRGAKWHLVKALMGSTDWAALSGGYEAVMLADDDLVMSTHVLNRAFDVFSAYGLALAQPSVCRHPYSFSVHGVVYQNEDCLLRYTAFVEIMAPMFSMATLRDVVAPTLVGAHTGWGLDFIWPFIMGYPRDRIAVIDDVCFYHPSSQLNKQSMYKLHGGMTAESEGTVQMERFGLNVTTRAAAGLDRAAQEAEWGSVPRGEGLRVMQHLRPAAEARTPSVPAPDAFQASTQPPPSAMAMTMMVVGTLLGFVAGRRTVRRRLPRHGSGATFSAPAAPDGGGEKPMLHLVHGGVVDGSRTASPRVIKLPSPGSE